MIKLSHADSSALFIGNSKAPVSKIGKPANDTKPDLEYETSLQANGYNNIAGIDEVGRGPLAGPVITAAVVLNTNTLLTGIDDSKRLNAAKREQIFEAIIHNSQFAIASTNSEVIDIINIRKATLMAMTRAVYALPVKTDWILIDGNDIPSPLKGKSTSIVKGDRRSISIAAASIVAKVIRDRMMVRYDRIFPNYGFAAHKGYGTKQHLDALNKYGPCPLHRLSFSPCANKKER